MYKVKNLETNQIEDWSIEQILDEINRDHSTEFTHHTEDDWEEGWEEWVEGYGYYELLKPYAVTYNVDRDIVWEYFNTKEDAEEFFNGIVADNEDCHLYILNYTGDYEVINSNTPIYNN